MRYVPYDLLDGRPNVVVDGSPAPGTLRILSHWPHSGTPWALKADLSAQIAFRYLEQPELAVDAELVSNNHLDEDGVVGVHVLTDPEHALAHRPLLEEVARAGDFATTSDRRAARVAFALTTLIERPGAGYEALLGQLPGLVADIDGARDLWAEEDDRVSAGEALFDTGLATIEERPDLDLSIVTLHGPEAPHPLVLHAHIAGLAVLTLAPGAPRLEYRYESWIQLVSRRPRARVDLEPLAELLGSVDAGPWRAGEPGDLTPVCAPVGGSDLDPRQVCDAVVEHLQRAPAAWDPYDPPDT